MSVGYVCHGQGFLYHLLTHHHFALPINGGDTAEAVAELGGHFMVVSTTANMLGSGTTPGHLDYMLNLFKLAATPLDSARPPRPTRGRARQRRGSPRGRPAG
jgi:hypothetical protein